jgi:Replication-relaxation
MIDKRSRRPDRVVRPRRSPSPSAAAMLADIDRRLLDVLCAHRVVRQDQLSRLFPHVPERTLRYRTRRLHDLGLAGRSRPYREHGSAPNHHWPTRRADCLMRGEPAPRGGERREPNPLFLAHAAALTEFYVAVYTTARAAGFKGLRYGREGDARETFKDGARERALAPDATFALIDEQDRNFFAFVEIDLGTMSHARLRAKADLYAAYVASDAWRARHPFLPALLFLTTTDIRASKFLKALARSLSHGPRSNTRRAFVAAAAGIVWAPHHLLSEPCFADLDGHTGLTLTHILNTARAPYEQALAHQRERRQASEERLSVLRDDPSAMREHLRRNEHRLGSYLQALGPAGVQAIKLLLASNATPQAQERGVLRTIARDLDEALLELQPHISDPPGPSVVGEVALLVEDYRANQAEQVRALIARHDDGPSLRRAGTLLREGELLDPSTLDGLAQDAEHDVDGRREQDEQRVVYLEWREQAARQLARKAGPLGRLTHPPADFYPQLDREHLKICGRCKETIYPRARRDGRYGSPPPPSCHYCREAHGVKPYDPTPTASEESEAYQ